MRAIVFAKPGVFSLEEVPDPVPGPREVLVRVEAVGLCGTDLHVLDGEFEPTVFPIIPGHETSGVVVEVGEQVTELAAGDRVSVDPTLTCGECSFCTNGRANLCENWNGSGVARTNGSTAELTVAPVKNVHRLSDPVDLQLAALIEPLSCAIRGYDLLPRRIGEHYLIYGAGTMGLMMAQLAPRAGAASVTVVDRNPARLAVAAEVGVTATVTSADEADREGGWDVVIDCTGVVAAIEDGLTRVRRGGTFQQFGVAATDAKASFSPFRVYNDEITVVGSMAVLNSYARAVEMFQAGALNAAPMVSHAFPLEEYGAALEMFRSGAGRKLQIRPQLQHSVELV
ncbi:MAG TPA: zinc-dependent alcohol dehydrogenase family protein [Propionibacteriaceae bacterium]|nr:zinc-dependent alcohol dehydrogenase family protein [Propionibacteriaceae bacterium]